MQKWIRDRMRRKKKKTQTDASAAMEAPLQPTYPDPEPELGTESNEQPQAPALAAEDSQPEADTKKPATARKSRRRKKKPQPSPEQPAIAADQEPAPAEEADLAASADVETPADAQEEVPAPAAADLEPEQPALVPTPVQVANDTVAEEAPAPAPTAESAPVPKPPAMSEKPRRGSKGAVILAVGLPGSGKSTWFKRHGITPLSSDMVRHLLFDNPTEQRYQDLVFGTLRSLLRARLIARMPLNYVDATNLSPKERRHWIKMAKDFGFEVQAVYFDVPLEVCTERNRRRNRIVPEDVMNRMAAKLKPPTFDEGFSKIVVVRVKHKPEAPGASDEQHAATNADVTAETE